jgi:hypothetical protein
MPNRGEPYEMFERIIIGNTETCRTEAEITDQSGTRLAMVYEDSNGWHTEVFGDWVQQIPSNFDTLIADAKEALSHYVNRRGDNVPGNMTAGSLSLWLMLKDDGTAMGRKLG